LFKKRIASLAVRLFFFYARKQLLRVLAIAILPVCSSHEWISQKRCKLGSPSLQHRKTLVSGTVKLFH